MARRVYLHVGLPKTGTTYLQSICWANRDLLREQGVLLPGFGPRQHLWATGVVRQEPNLDRRAADAKHAWAALSGEVANWPDTGLISHEFFAGASERQVARALVDLDPAEVHVVVTAREMVSLVTARWQEFVKNGATTPIDDYPLSEDSDPHDEWGWATMDVGDVVRRWGATLPPEQVHVLTLPKPSEPRDALWQRFAGLVGIDPDSCDVSVSQANESLGVVEVELLRRVNAGLSGFRSPLNRGVWIRGYLAQGKLVPRGGERFWPSAERITELRERGERAVTELLGSGCDILGDIDDLRTPADVSARRHPSTVTDTEMLDVATSTIGQMLGDVRRLSNRARGSDQPPSLAGRLARRLGWRR